ncbi:DUF1269 domain-containing protein [Streptomyces sp. NPDC050610]|uniref:DUF1269 domain-containing protein n=1 Tax=Streptomyces sp. NPDC050610 TaxID=3157097 RepID=UPI00341A4149
MTENVLFMDLDRPETGRLALDALRQAHAEGGVKLREATVITRDAEGALDFPDSVDNSGDARGFAVGGLIGGLVGILGGPLGIMIGFGAGGLLGGAHDARQASASSAALEMLAAEVPPGSTVLIAEVAEDFPEIVDEALAPYGPGAVRYPAEEVRKGVEEAIAEGR